MGQGWGGLAVLGTRGEFYRDAASASEPPRIDKDNAASNPIGRAPVEARRVMHGDRTNHYNLTNAPSGAVTPHRADTLYDQIPNGHRTSDT